MTLGERRTPVCSSAALACPLLLTGVFVFLSTSAGRDFNERVFGRYYTAGMLLMLGFYGLIVIALVGLGVMLGVMGHRRGETPAWLPWLAIAANIVVPWAVFFGLGL